MRTIFVPFILALSTLPACVEPTSLDEQAAELGTGPVVLGAQCVSRSALTSTQRAAVDSVERALVMTPAQRAAAGVELTTHTAQSTSDQRAEAGLAGQTCPSAADWICQAWYRPGSFDLRVQCITTDGDWTCTLGDGRTTCHQR